MAEGAERFLTGKPCAGSVLTDAVEVKLGFAFTCTSCPNPLISVVKASSLMSIMSELFSMDESVSEMSVFTSVFIVDDPDSFVTYGMIQLVTFDHTWSNFVTCGHI